MSIQNVVKEMQAQAKTNEAADRPKNHFWLKIGVSNLEGGKDPASVQEITSLPWDTAVETMGKAKVNGSPEWQRIQEEKNNLLEALIEAFEGLEPGKLVEAPLTVWLYRSEEKSDAPVEGARTFKFTFDE